MNKKPIKIVTSSLYGKFGQHKQPKNIMYKGGYVYAIEPGKKYTIKQEPRDISELYPPIFYK